MIKDSGRFYLYRHIRLDKNEPFYIGIGSKSLKRKCINLNCICQRAFQKKGRGDIWNKIFNKTKYEVEILLESDDYNFIKQKEIEFIKLYGRINLKTGILANLTDGGDGNIGLVITQEHRDNISKSRKKIIEDRGYLHSPEVRLIIAQNSLGRHHTEETKEVLRRKIRERSYKGLDKARETCKRPIEQFDLQDNFVASYESLVEAGKQTGINFRMIQFVCVGKRKKTHNFKFKYKTI